MRLFETAKDGGDKSTVTGFFIIEMKWLFSIVLLHFADGSRDAYHFHAFGALSWVLKGKLTEHMLDGRVKVFTPSLRPKVTPRKCFHKVVSDKDSWVLTIRGPWINRWREYHPQTKEFVTFTHGRKVV